MMLCDTCKQGGIMNTYGHYQLARERHNECEYEGCACQHRVGKDNIRTVKNPHTEVQGLITGNAV